MGTRSLTFVYDNEDNQPKRIVCMYRQFDGYPHGGHGEELSEFLLSGKLVNGFGDSIEKQFNGMGCLAAQMIAHFKTGVGGFYLYPTDTTDAWQDYEYHVYFDKVRIEGRKGKEIFSGTWQEFNKFCTTPIEE